MFPLRGRRETARAAPPSPSGPRARGSERLGLRWPRFPSLIRFLSSPHLPIPWPATLDFLFPFFISGFHPPLLSFPSFSSPSPLPRSPFLFLFLLLPSTLFPSPHQLLHPIFSSPFLHQFTIPFSSFPSPPIFQPLLPTLLTSPFFPPFPSFFSLSSSPILLSFSHPSS